MQSETVFPVSQILEVIIAGILRLFNKIPYNSMRFVAEVGTKRKPSLYPNHNPDYRDVQYFGYKIFFT